MKRLAPLLLSLALLFGLAGPALAVDPRTDPVTGPRATTAGDPVVVTDPVPSDQPWWLTTYGPLPVEPAAWTTGSSLALIGTYVGEVGRRRYIPAFQYQLLWSDPMGGYSCTAYSMAMAIDKATYGGTRATGQRIRELSGAPSYSGLTLADVQRASTALLVPVIRVTGTWTAVENALRQNRGVVLQGDYDQVPAKYSGQLSFKGNHAIYLDYLHSSGDWVYVMDPLSKEGPRWWPVSVLQAFAEKLARDNRIYPDVFFSYTRATRLVR